jgi:hypothetical protein
MAVTGYFDASGSPDDGSVLVVSGFVSSARRWARFDSEWSKILQDSGIRVFHMEEFAHSTGEFKNWKREEEKRRKLLRDLIDVPASKVFRSFAGAVVLDDWKRCNEE